MALAFSVGAEAKTIAWGRFYGAPRFSHRVQPVPLLQWPPLLTLKEATSSQAGLVAKRESKQPVTISITFPAHAAPNVTLSKPLTLKGLLTEHPDTHAVSIVFR